MATGYRRTRLLRWGTALAWSGIGVLPFLVPPGLTQAAPPAQPAQKFPAAAVDPNRRVVAYVHGNVPIYRDEFSEYLISRGGMDKVELLVNRRVIEVAMIRRGLTITGHEIDGAYEYDLRGAKVDAATFLQYISERYGKSEFEWKQDVIRPRLQLGKMCNSGIAITPKEMQDAFDSRYGEKREAQLIVWPKTTELPAAEREKARSSVLAFDRLAALQPDQRLAQSHGRVNPVGRHIDGEDPKVEKALFSLKADEISEWIETPTTWTCIHCVKISPPEDPKLTLAMVEKEIRQEVYDRKLNAAIPLLFAELKKEANPQLTKQVPLPADYDRAHPPIRIAHPDPNVLAVVYGNIEITREDLGDFIIVRGGFDKLELLVNRRIIELEAMKRGVALAPAEIEAAKKAYVAKLGIPNITVADFVKHVLPKRNMSEFAWIEDVIKPELAMAKMCRERIKIGDEELHKAFTHHYGEKRAAKIIMWRKDEFRIAEKQWDEARKGDVDFDRIARMQFNPALAAGAGKVAPIGRYPDADNTLVADTVFSLQPGELSHLLGTPAGIMCVKCVAVVPPVSGVAFETVRDSLQKEVFEQKLSREFGTFFGELKQAANPNILLRGPSNGRDVEEHNKYVVEQAIGPHK